jgi:hypothetical protein
MATIKKAQGGNKLKPNYSNIKGKGWDLFKTPTSKDSADYRKGFDKKIKGEDLKQYPSPTGAEVRGYNEASKRTTKAKDGKWIQKATASIKRRGTEGKCTPITKPGCTGKAKVLAKTFKKIAKARKGK